MPIYEFRCDRCQRRSSRIRPQRQFTGAGCLFSLRLE